MSSQIAPTSEAFAASGTGKSFGETTSCRAYNLLLVLLVVYWLGLLVHGLWVLRVVWILWGSSVGMIAVLDHGHRLVHLRGRGVAHASGQVAERLRIDGVVERGRGLRRVSRRGVRRVRGDTTLGAILRLYPVVVWHVEALRVLRGGHVVRGRRIVLGHFVLGLHGSWDIRSFWLPIVSIQNGIQFHLGDCADAISSRAGPQQRIDPREQHPMRMRRCASGWCIGLLTEMADLLAESILSTR